MLITKLARNSNTGRVDIFIDDKYALSVGDKLLLDFSLNKGKELTEEELAQLKESSLIEKYFNKALDQIARRPRSKKEIIDYINKKEYKKSGNFPDLTLANSVVERLESNKYIDDIDFASWWVKSRTNSGRKSKLEITKELRQKGLDNEIIKQTLAKNIGQNDEEEIIIKLALKKLKTAKGSGIDEKKKKVVAYLLRKGFNYELINKILKNIN